MPVFPGAEPPVFRTAGSIDEVGYAEKRITLSSHTGTHLDAPAHLIKGSKTLDLLPTGQFYGMAFLLNLTDLVNRIIGIEKLEPHRAAINQNEFLLVHTGWSRYWGRAEYFSDYPVLSPDAADWLGGLGLKGVGLDTVSADEFDAAGLPVHRILLGYDTLIIENLTNLDRLDDDRFVFSCFPLYLEDADGSPARAVAIIP